MTLDWSKGLRKKNETTYALGKPRGAEERSGKHDYEIDKKSERGRKGME